MAVGLVYLVGNVFVNYEWMLREQSENLQESEGLPGRKKKLVQELLDLAQSDTKLSLQEAVEIYFDRHELRSDYAALDALKITGDNGYLEQKPSLRLCTYLCLISKESSQVENAVIELLAEDATSYPDLRLNEWTERFLSAAGINLTAISALNQLGILGERGHIVENPELSVRDYLSLVPEEMLPANYLY